MKYIFEWKDDKVIIKLKNNKPQRFQNLQVGAGVGGENSGADGPANAIIRNLDYTSKGKTQKYRNRQNVYYIQIFNIRNNRSCMFKNINNFRTNTIINHFKRFI